MNTLIDTIIFWGIPLLCAIILHEIAHGYVALLCGDTTAKKAKRLSLNPLRHIDPFGSLVLPGILWLIQAPFLFGYAKPVPVDFRRLSHIRRDTFLVAIAGPLTNVILALMASLLLHAVAITLPTFTLLMVHFLHNFILINCVLAIFNLLPIPPLDGFRILTTLLPLKLALWYGQLERYSFLFLGIIFVIPLLTQMLFGVSINILSPLILEPTRLLIDGIGIVTGHMT